MDKEGSSGRWKYAGKNGVSPLCTQGRLPSSSTIAKSVDVLGEGMPKDSVEDGIGLDMSPCRIRS